MNHDNRLLQLTVCVACLVGSVGDAGARGDEQASSVAVTYRQVLRFDPSEGASDAARVESAGPVVSVHAGDLPPRKAWPLGPGRPVVLELDLPEGAVGESVHVTLIGLEGTAEQRAASATINGAQAVELPVPPAAGLATSTLLGGGALLRAGTNRIELTVGDGVAAGLAAVEVAYRMAYRSGEGLNLDHLPPLPWDGSHGEPDNPTARAQQHEARLAEVRDAAAPVRLTLLSPRPDALFGTAGGVRVEWLAEGFPVGSGVAILYQVGDGPWQVIEGAEALPFHHPNGTGNRGSFTWQPAEPLEGARIGLGYVVTAKREPGRLVVGPDEPFRTIGEALRVAYHGDTIVLSAGAYAESVTLYHDVRIIGADREACVLSPTQSRGIVVAKGVKASIENLTIDGAARMRDHGDVWGVHAPSSQVTVRDVTIRNVERGIVVNWPGAEGTLSNITMAALQYGLTATRGASVTLTDTAIALAGGDDRGVLVDLGGTVRAERVRITGTTMPAKGVGFGVWGAGSTLQATDCTVHATNNGIYVADAGSARLVNVHAAGLVEGRPVENAMEYALHIAEGGSATVIGSELAHCFNPCVTVRGGGSVSLTNCKVHHSSQSAMLVDGSGVAEVLMTEFTDSYNGVQAQPGAKVTMTRGVLRRNSTGFHAVEGSQLSISDSDASDNRAWGYYGPGISRSNHGANNGNGTFGPR